MTAALEVLAAQLEHEDDGGPARVRAFGSTTAPARPGSRLGCSSRAAPPQKAVAARSCRSGLGALRRPPRLDRVASPGLCCPRPATMVSPELF